MKAMADASADSVGEDMNHASWVAAVSTIEHDSNNAMAESLFITES
jgi:hypothetical protein